MSGCTQIRELLSLYLEDELESGQSEIVRSHLESCRDCGELVETMCEITAAGAALEGLEPPGSLQDELTSSPCRLWLGLLFLAVDREISQRNLKRLLSHLEGCPSCREAWQDLTLIHQVGEAMEPPANLTAKCINVRIKRPGAPRILNRRLATAAAYLLAVMTSLVIGNPVTLARTQAAPAVERVAQTISQEVSGVAQQGRGEARVMLWRLWKWGERKAEAVRDFVTGDESTEEASADDATADDGESS
jgi:predicted anti-sigma-YlaC factor YlaD